MKKMISLFIISFLFISQTNLIGMQCFKNLAKKLKKNNKNFVSINSSEPTEIKIEEYGYPETENQIQYKVDDRCASCCRDSLGHVHYTRFGNTYYPCDIQEYILLSAAGVVICTILLCVMIPTIIIGNAIAKKL